MPIVDTSVAVATPSITAARITNGSATAGNAMSKALPISRPVAAARHGDRSSPR